MKALSIIFSATILMTMFFATQSFAGVGQVVDINPSGTVAKVIDENGEVATVINKGKEFDIEVGTVVTFDAVNSNGNDNAPANGNAPSFAAGVITCAGSLCE